MTSFQINPLGDNSRSWAERLIEEQCGVPVIISRGVAHLIGDLPGYVAQRDDEYIGLATYCVQGDACEMVSAQCRAGIWRRLGPDRGGQKSCHRCQMQTDVADHDER